MPEKTPQLPIRVNIDAKAEARLELKGQLPERSIGRFLDAITDLVRPLCEARGFRADQIRLQREDVLLEIAKRARHRIEIENAQICPIPLKLLVPLLEKASIESESDTFMLDQWANLIASAATTKGSVNPHFVSILAEISSDQAKLLRNIFFSEGDCKFYDHGIYVDYKMVGPYKNFLFLSYNGNKFELSQSLLEDDFAAALRTKNLTHEKFYEIVAEFMNVIDRSCGVVMYSYLVRSDSRNPTDQVPSESDLGLHVLEALNLLKRKHFRFRKGKYELEISYFQISPLGTNFLSACSPETKAKMESYDDTIRFIN